MARTNFTTPVGRILMGSLYKAQTKDAEGNPLIIKSGPNAGQPKIQYFFAVGIPKGKETHWAQTEWGAKIYAVGQAAFPVQHQAPTFAWKIVDGDSQIPNLQMKKPCDREGYPGHWVLSFTSGFAPRIYNRDGTQAITEDNAVKPGYYVQVNADADTNSSTQKPGIFLNHNMVALSAYGPEIKTGMDVAEAGFGQAPLPVGALSAPQAGFNPAAPAGIAMAAPTPVMGIAINAPTTAAVAPPAMPAVPPNPAFLQVPGLPPAPVAHQMTPKANGASYEQMKAAGWTDEMMVQHGMMVR